MIQSNNYFTSTRGWNSSQHCQIHVHFVCNDSTIHIKLQSCHSSASRMKANGLGAWFLSGVLGLLPPYPRSERHRASTPVP